MCSTMFKPRKNIFNFIQGNEWRLSFARLSLQHSHDRSRKEYLNDIVLLLNLSARVVSEIFICPGDHKLHYGMNES